VAAGRGERLGSDGPKAFVVLGGRPMLAWSLEVLAESPHVDALVVVAPEGHVGEVADLADGPLTVVAGGEERSHSVRNGLAAVPAHAELVLVHDAARPLVQAETVEACLAAMVDPSVDAAIAATPVTDTTKEAAPDADGTVVVTATLDRSRLWAVQTPQVFRRAVLDRVLAQSDDVLAAATDDASLVEAAGGRVVLVPSPRANLKVTTPEDLRLAELLLADRPGP
jgi:2-C-methyl-D-erythritol 4-phosphate cytidylyltransferase